ADHRQEPLPGTDGDFGLAALVQKACDGRAPPGAILTAPGAPEAALLGGLGASLLFQRRRLRQLGGDSRRLVGPHHAKFLVQLVLHVAEDLGVELEEVARVLAALPDALAAVAEPGA